MVFLALRLQLGSGILSTGFNKELNPKAFKRIQNKLFDD